MANKLNSLAHTKWLCKYHIVFIPKYRRKIIYYQYRKDLIEIIKLLCQYKGVKNYRRTYDARSCTSFSKCSPKAECIKFYGILKGEKCIDDV
ncbi:transposase [Ligilactobacillus salivarius]|uniref:transposase n=1 Tax=Ligilactobacillus salivarius TaxID=1624 RepID=UPI0002F96236